MVSRQGQAIALILSLTQPRATRVSVAAAEVATLKQQAGRDMVIWGSISVAQCLMKAELIDEYRLVICPVVLGSGRPLFGDKVNKREMRVLETKPFDRGAVLLRYVVAESPSQERRRSETSKDERRLADPMR
jgi:dihydrofolate reductase